jgi:uncharacterized protein YjbJ (UPF0337 family)
MAEKSKGKMKEAAGAAAGDEKTPGPRNARNRGR